MRKMLLAAGFFVALSGPTRAASECSYAARGYHRTLDEIGFALRSYSRCIDDSRAANDCSVEFKYLKSAQADFELAISEYQSSCG